MHKYFFVEIIATHATIYCTNKIDVQIRVMRWVSENGVILRTVSPRHVEIFIVPERALIQLTEWFCAYSFAKRIRKWLYSQFGDEKGFVVVVWFCHEQVSVSMLAQAST